MRILWIIVLGLLAFVVWDSIENDGQWGRAAGQTVQQDVDEVLRQLGLAI
jgi:hypothetical protein